MRRHRSNRRPTVVRPLRPRLELLGLEDRVVPSTVQFSTTTYQINEGTAAVNINVERSDASVNGEQVKVVLNAGGSATTADFSTAGLPVTITFANGSKTATQSVTLSTVADGLIEGTETINLGLQAVGGVTIGAANTALVSIIDANKATASFKTALATVTEGKTDPIVVVLNTGGAKLVNATSYKINTNLGTAEAADFNAPVATVTFAAGSVNGATQIINVGTLTDTIVEGNETLALTLAPNTGVGTVGTTKTHGVTIVDANTATVAFSTSTSKVAEGANTKVTAKLTITGGAKLAEDAVFNVTTSLGSASKTDFTVPATITFAANSVTGATQDITVDAATDLAAEGDETFTLGLTVKQGPATVTAGASNVVTITDNTKPTVTFGAAKTSFAEDGAAHGVDITLNIPGGGSLDKDLVVNVTTKLGTAASSDFSLDVTQVTFPAGSLDGTIKTVNFTPTDDTFVEKDETVTLNLGIVGTAATVGTNGSNAVTITDNDTANAQYRNILFGDWNGDGIDDLVYVRNSTADAKTKVQILDGSTNFTTDLLPLSDINLKQTDTTWDFGIGDFNGDGTLDLVSIKKSGGTSKTTEIHVLSGADAGAGVFGTFLFHGQSSLHETGRDWQFQVVDFNGDGKVDVVGFKMNGAGSGKTEVHVLDGSNNYLSFVLQTTTGLSQTGSEASFVLADYNRDGVLDLVEVVKSGTASGNVEISALSGVGNFQTFLVDRVDTLRPLPAGAEVVFAAGDLNADNTLDLFDIRKFGTLSGKVEIDIVDGVTGTSTHLVTSLNATNI